MSSQREAKQRAFTCYLAKLSMACILIVLPGATIPTWGQACVPPPANVISWWSGDGNTADYIDSNPGALQNGATFAPGFVGQAFSLDGIDDFVSIPESPNLEISDVITMDAWIKTPGVGVHLQGIVGKMMRANPPRSGYLTSVDQNGKFRCDIIRSIPPQGTAISLTTVTDNVFHHVACTYNGTSVSVYVDGNLERSVAYSDGIGLNDEPVRIGYDTADQFLGTRWFKGLIDEVRIFHRALCPSEIKAIFQAGSQGQCKDGTSGDTSCDDGNACTTGDTCNGGDCMGGPPPDCNDNNICTDDSCTPSVGCVHVDNAAPCDDGNACTLTDSCQAGACSGSNPVVCTALDQCHDLGACGPSTGVCSNPAKPDGTMCNDGTPCTTSDTCNSGVCVGGPPPPELCNSVDDDCDGTIDEGCVGKITGGGEIQVPGGEANFGFVAQRKAIGDASSGQLEYHNHARNLNVHSTSILTLTVVGNTATFSGECTKNQAPCTFSVTVEDNGEPGGDVDRFTIEVSGEPIEGGVIPIIKGNIQTHEPANGPARSLLETVEQSPNALAGAGGGVFPGGTSFEGVALTGLRFGTGIDIPGNGSANGTHETTLLGISSLGQPQTITVEVAATSGYVTPSGNVYVSGVSRVDMGDGTPPRTDVQFSLAVATDAQGHPAMTLVVDTTSLPVATIDRGGITPPACIPPLEVGTGLSLTSATELSWSASDAASTYNLYRGIMGGGSRPFDPVCLAPGLPGPTAIDIASPSSGQIFYYLVSGKNACGEGSLGASSNGQPRPNPSPCP